MALQHTKINDKYITADLYYRIEGIDFQSGNIALVYVNGYSNDEDRVLLDQQVYTITKSKEEPISYEEVYNYLKDLDEFKDSLDV